MSVDGRVLVGRYRLGQRLGSGGMADVYQALDLRLQRPVAVKILHPHLATDPEFVERFEREARAVAALNHSNIVAVYDYGVDGDPFLVMELVDGRSLAELLRQQGALPLQRALALVGDVLAALAYAHARGLVHCDVKAENVLLTAEGHAKLADFGIARAAATTALTQTNQLFGSVHYLAPERLAGGPATPAVDLYGVGVLLYLVLTGRLPFVGDNAAVVIAQHHQQLPRPPSELRPDLPSWLEQIVLRAMAKEPEDRFLSARAMELDLRGGRSDDSHDLPTVRIASSDATTVRVQRDATPPGGRGPRPGGNRSLLGRVPRRYAISLAALPILAALGLAWNLAARAGAPTSPPTVAPTPVVIASAPLSATRTVAPATATATRPVATATPTRAPATPTPTPSGAASSQILDQLHALVASSDAKAWKGNKKREFLKQLDGLEKDLAENKTRDARDQLRELTQQASEMARDGEIDGRLATQIIAQLQTLANRF